MPTVRGRSPPPRKRKRRWGLTKAALRAEAQKRADRIAGEIIFRRRVAARLAAFAARPLVCLGRRNRPLKYVPNTKSGLGRCSGCLNGRWFSASKHCPEDTPDSRRCPYCQSWMTTILFTVGCSCKKRDSGTSDDSESESEGMSN